MVNLPEELVSRIVVEFPNEEGVIRVAAARDDMPPIIDLFVKGLNHPDFSRDIKNFKDSGEFKESNLKEKRARLESLLDEIQVAILRR